MKKIFNNIMIVLATMVAATACTPEVEDAFDTTSSERIDNYTKNVREILTAAPNGWSVEYYASTTYGGYNVFAKFDKDSVVMASESLGTNHAAGMDKDGKLLTSKTKYKIEQSMGAILSFDTYNTIFHYFAEPKNPDGYGDSGDGLGGDFEFRVITATADSIILQGKKHQARVKMYPMPADETWEDAYNKIQEVEKNMSARTYYLMKDGKDLNVTVTTSYRRLVFDYFDEEGEENAVAAPFIVTKDGYKFYSAYKLLDMTLQGFNNGEDGVYVATNDPSITLEAQTLPLYEQLIGSSWFITYDNLGSYAQPYWDTFKTALETAGGNNTKATLYWALIGKYNGKVGYTMNAGGDEAIIGFTITKEDEEGNRVKIKYNSKDCNKNGTNFYDKHSLKDALTPFIGKSKVTNRVFDLTVDNKRHPSYMILTDINEPTNVIRLEAEPIYYPFGDEPLEK